MKRSYRLTLVAALSLVYFVALLHYAQIRGVDPDEGFYPTAARLTWEGKIPYRDFMFSQGVVIPYAYGWIWAVHPQSLAAMRVLSVMLGAVTVFLWGLFLLSLKRLPTSVAFSAFLVMLVNPYWIALHSVFKTFAVADLLTSVALMSLYWGIESGRAKWFAAAGVALGLCASARALYGPLIVIVPVFLFLVDWKESEWRFRRILAYVAGAVCGAVPMMLSFAADPAAFLFNSFRYRPLLDSYWTTSFRQTIQLHFLDVYYIVQRRFFGAELILAVLGIISLVELRKKKDRPYTRGDYQFLFLVLLMMAAYIAVSLVPLPTFAQYLDAPLLPFLIFFIAEGLRVSYRVSWKWAVVFLIVAPVLCVRGVRTEVGEFSAEPRLQLASYRKVANIIRQNSAPDAIVLSVWPGYVFESGRRCFPGGENEFVYKVANKVSPQTRERYHLIGKQEVTRAISRGLPDIYIPVALGRYLSNTMSDDEYQELQKAVASRYSLLATVDDVEIYRKNR
jgi:hypothetical protein